MCSIGNTTRKATIVVPVLMTFDRPLDLEARGWRKPRYSLPMSNRTIRITTTSPRPPLGP